MQRLTAGVCLGDCGGDREAGADSTFGIGFASLRPTKVDQHTVADVAGDETAELRGASADDRQALFRQFFHNRGIAQDVVDRLFGGSTSAVMQHLLETSDLDDEEQRHEHDGHGAEAEDLCRPPAMGGHLDDRVNGAHQ